MDWILSEISTQSQEKKFKKRFQTKRDLIMDFN